MSDEPSLAELQDAYEDQILLVEIGERLLSEKNPDKLLRLILDSCRRITGADAGSLFLCEEGEKGPQLRFKHSHTASRPLDYFEEFTMPRDERSIAGYVSLSRQALNIPDVYLLDKKLPFRFNPGYDSNSGYRTKSMLVVPMCDHEGAAIGVIQLINSKEGADASGPEVAAAVTLETAEDFETKVHPFKKRYESLLVAVANQAAMALENSRMIAAIKRQFYSFVRASVGAIESRDPATSGHSYRVAKTAVALMAAVDAEKDGLYGPCFFGEDERRELEYAGLLHDFGKVYLDPRIFTKAKKLFEKDYDYLVMRLKYLHRTTELDFARREIAALREGRGDEAACAEEECGQAVTVLLRAMNLVADLNEPQALSIDLDTGLKELAASAPRPEILADLDGSPLPFLTEEERANLAIRRGSLNEVERKIIQSHVEYTETFVSNIPWPRMLRGIPEYCVKHHEMLDGSGYPKGIKGDQIPLQARMLAIADVFDALSAPDRPYKKAIPFSAAKEILEDEARKGRLDAEMVRIFFEKECWK
jgi:HD-GYP domain-containing protein (c-di-GMP phosphodiesterase class II)